MSGNALPVRYTFSIGMYTRAEHSAVHRIHSEVFEMAATTILRIPYRNTMITKPRAHSQLSIIALFTKH